MNLIICSMEHSKPICNLTFESSCFKSFNCSLLKIKIKSANFV